MDCTDCTDLPDGQRDGLPDGGSTARLGESTSELALSDAANHDDDVAGITFVRRRRHGHSDDMKRYR